MALDLTPLVPVIISVGGAIGGAIYARRRGLPDLSAEVDAQTNALIKVLREQLEIANAELSKLRPQLAAAEVRIGHLEEEVERLEKRAIQLYIRIDELERKAKAHP